MSNYEKHDPLKWAEDKEIKDIIGTEELLYCDKITKINKYHFSQERVLILTDKALYNLKKKELKRKLDYSFILGVTLSKLTYEFIIHGADAEYDYDYISEDRGLIIAIIAKCFEKNFEKKLKISIIEEKNLKNFVTSKKEKENKSNFTKMDMKFLIDTSTFLKEIDMSEGLYGKSRKNRRNNTLMSKHKTAKIVNLDDFNILKVLGRGSFGKVCLVQYKRTGEYFAMKSLKKDVLLSEDQIESTILEKKILQNLEHPFLVGLVFCFQTIERIYFVMPFVRGGELYIHLRKNKYFDQKTVCFYAAIIGTAIDYLHKKGIVYRDVKPENILLDEEGYLKLADFGMARLLQSDEKALSFCGTPEYLAPEIITGEGHNRAADWWSFGVVIFEMLCGIPPFYSKNTEKMYEFICGAEVRFPKKIEFSEEAKDLIRKLLVKDQDKRLGSVSGFDEIRSHPFFKDIDFDLLLKKKIVPPFKPNLKDIEDVSNFDPEFTNEEVVNSAINEKNLEILKENQKEFEEFDK